MMGEELGKERETRAEKERVTEEEWMETEWIFWMENWEERAWEQSHEKACSISSRGTSELKGGVLEEGKETEGAKKEQKRSRWSWRLRAGV